MCVDYATFQGATLARAHIRKEGKTLEIGSLQRVYGSLKIFLTVELRASTIKLALFSTQPDIRKNADGELGGGASAFAVVKLFEGSW